MVVAVTPGQTWDWIHPSDRDKPEDEQTIFTFRTLTSAQHRRISNKAAASPHLSKEDKASGEIGITEFRTGDYQYFLIKEGLENVTNLRGEDGNPIPYECMEFGTKDGRVKRVTDKFLDRIPNEVLLDAASEIDKGNSFEEEDRKN